MGGEQPALSRAERISRRLPLDIPTNWTSTILRIVDDLRPAAAHEDQLAKALALNRAVIMPGLTRPSRKKDKILDADVHGAMRPKRRHIGGRASFHLDDLTGAAFMLHHQTALP